MTESDDYARIDGSIVGELLLGEIPFWNVGVCRLYVTEDGHDIVVKDMDSGHIADVVGTEKYRQSLIDATQQVKDLPAIAKDVNYVLDDVHADL